MRLATIIHDVYDDPNGVVLVQDHVRSDLHPKVASLQLMPAEKLSALPDRVFALVGTYQGTPLRKYAMHDEAHLRASVLYFEQAGASALPLPVAIKVAQNLLVGCDWYDVPVSEDLKKLAGLGSQVGNLVTGAFGAADMAAQAQALPGHVRGGVQAATHAQNLGKKASVEITYTDDEIARLMGNPEPSTENVILSNALSIGASKTKKADVPAHVMPRSGSLPSVPTSTTATTERSTAKVSEVVEVGEIYMPAFTPPPSVKIAAHLTVGSYPLDTEEEVKLASAWLEDNQAELGVHDRRVMAQSIHIRAEELGLGVNAETLLKYAGDGFGDFVAAELSWRAVAFEDTLFEAPYKELSAKHASLDPAMVVAELMHLDNASGVDLSWNRALGGFRDPYRAVYEKTAVDHGQYTWSSGTDYTSAMLLERLAAEYPLNKVLDDDLAKAFKKDPVGIFKSLPDPEKQVLARLSGQQHSGMI